MDFGEMKAEVALTLGNMQTGDPFFASLGAWVNRGIQQTEIMALGGNKSNQNLFPPLKTSWISPITIAGQSYFDLPSNKLAVTRLLSYDSDVAIDRAIDKARPMVKDTIQGIEQATKGTTPSGYPRRWAFEASRVYFTPTPSADYLTYLWAIGFQKDLTLATDSETPLADEMWHEAFVQKACAIGAVKLGWDPSIYTNEVLAFIGTATDILGLEDGNDDAVVEVDGSASQETVYGAA